MARAKKPDCSDFIVAAARSIRMKPSNLKKGTSAGVSLNRLFSVAKEVYTANEFHKSLKSLIKNKTILMMGDEVDRMKVEGQKHDAWGRHRIVKIIDVPTNAPFLKRSWCLDSNGKITDPECKDIEEYRMIQNILLYISSDGLPDKIKKFVSRIKRSRAQEIIATMQKTK